MSSVALPSMGVEPHPESTTPVFSVVTPSFNMLPYLMRCASSIADQGIAHQHIVVDGGSRDGTPEWLSRRQEIGSVVEPDRGMYDAVNKGLSRARGQYVSYLNCDEQYLPGTLAAVQRFFEAHPRVDIVFGGALLVRPDGTLLGYRKAYQPRYAYIASSHLYVLSCTMFLRRRVIDEGFRFDMKWRDVGDAEFVLRILRSGYRAAYLRRYLSAFTMTGSNMSAGANARSESGRLHAAQPRWCRRLSLPLNAMRLLEKTFAGAYRERFPLSYALYAGSGTNREAFSVDCASWRWPT